MADDWDDGWEDVTPAPAKPRSLWERFIDNIVGNAVQTPLGAEAVIRYGTKHGNDPERLRRAERKVIADYERKQAADPAWGGRNYPINQTEIVKGVTDFLGGLIGSADPTMVLGPGRTIAQRIAAQTGINAAVDAGSQGIEIKRRVRDKYDPVRTGFAAGTGLVFQGGVEAGGKINTGRRVARGSKMPGWQEVNDVIVRDLEGGGTLKNPKVSPKGAMGPQQVMPDTARKPGFGIRPWDGKTQADLARVGRQYSAAMMDKYDGDPRKVLAAYNAGPGRVDGLIKRYGDDWADHLPLETRKYVAKGMSKLTGGRREAEKRAGQPIIEDFDFSENPSAAIDPNDWDQYDWYSKMPLHRDFRRSMPEELQPIYDKINRDENPTKAEADALDDWFKRREATIDSLRPEDKIKSLRHQPDRNADAAFYHYESMGQLPLGPMTREAIFQIADSMGIARGEAAWKYVNRLLDEKNGVVQELGWDGENAFMREVRDLRDTLAGQQFDEFDLANYKGMEAEPGSLPRRDVAIPQHDKMIPGSGLRKLKNVTPRRDGSDQYPRPPYPGEEGFPKPGEFGNRGGPKGGPDEPIDFGKYKKDREAADFKAKLASSVNNAKAELANVKARVAAFRRNGEWPMTYQETAEAIEEWRGYRDRVRARQDHPKELWETAHRIYALLKSVQRKMDAQVIPDQPVKGKRGPAGLGKGSVATTPVNDIKAQRGESLPGSRDGSDVYPLPPKPGDPDFPVSKNKLFGGDDRPFDIRRTLATVDETLTQLREVNGRIPLTIEQINDTIKQWRATALQAIRDKDGDPELRMEARRKIAQIVDELEQIQDRMLAEPPKAAPVRETPQAKPKKAPKDPNPEGYPEAPAGSKAPRDPPREPPRDEGGDGFDDEPDRDKYLGSINTERLDMSEETYAILEEIMAEHEFDIKTHGEMRAEAEQLLKNESVTDILTADPKLSEAIPYQIAIRTILMDSLGKEVEISRMILDPSQRSDELIGMQNLQRVRTAAAADAASGIAGRAGQLLSSFKVNVGTNAPSQKAIREMLKLNPGQMDPESYAEAFLRMWNNKEGRVKLAKDSLNPDMISYITQLRYSMMLSGLGTHIKNSVETMKVMGQTVFENLMAAPIGLARSAIGGDAADRVTALESASRIYGLWRAALNAETYKNAGRSFAEGTPVNKVSKVEGGEMLMPFPFNVPQRALAAADSFFRGFIETSDIYGMSMRKAHEEGLSGKAMWDRGEEIANEAFVKAAEYNKARQDLIDKKISKKEFNAIAAATGDYKDIIEHSEHHAEVLQMLSEPSALTRWIEKGKTRKPNMHAGEKMLRLAANMLFPFARVSDRLVFHAVRRSPLAFLDNETVKAFKKGGAEMDEAAARIMFGTAILSYYAQQALNGERTGDGPRNPQKRKALEATGWQPNSTFDAATGTYRDSTAFATEGIPAGLMATLVERYKAGEISAEDYLTSAMDVLRSLAQSFKNNTYLEGGGSFFSALEDNPLGDTAWANFVGGMGASFTPAAARQYNNTLDPVARDTTGDRSFADRVIGRIKSGVPGLSTDLPARSDVYGQDVLKDPDLETAITGVGKERQRVTDPVMVELARLEETQNETLVSPPAKAWEGVKLDAQQFQEYQRESGKLFIDNMRAVMMDFDWAEMTDAEKKAKVKKVLTQSRKEVHEWLFPKDEDDGWEDW